MLLQRSIQFEQYKDVKEEELLIWDFIAQKIGDYNEVDWKWIKGLLYGKEKRNESKIYFKIHGELNAFIDRVISRDERVRILSFLRDNCRECLFIEDYDETCICNFEDECARLITKNLKQSKFDQVHGMVHEEPQPNLFEIALGHSSREYEDWEKVIMENIPNFTIYQTPVSKDILLQIAYEFIEDFRNAEKTCDIKTTPLTTPQHYENSLYTLIGKRANRFLFKDFNPVYQVFFIVYIIMCLPNCNHLEGEEELLKNIELYLEGAQINGGKQKLKEALQKIEKQIQTTGMSNNENMQEIHFHFHNKVGQVIGNVENLNITKK